LNIKKSILGHVFALFWIAVCMSLAFSSANSESSTKTASSTNSVLPLSLFIDKVTKSDPKFPLILLDELYLRYQKDLNLPASDLILAVTGQYNLFLPTESLKSNAPFEGNISLSKLFPATGTLISGQYMNSFSQNQYGIFQRSSIGVTLSQSISQNAFGILTRMQEKKIDVDMNIIRFQIIEAYEDYLSSIIQLYLDWYASYENVKTAKNILDYNTDILKNLKRKRRYKIALREDLYKMEYEVINAQENVSTLEHQYESIREKVHSLAKIPISDSLKPKNPKFIQSKSSQKDFQSIFQNCRTNLILQKSKHSAIIATYIAERNLLPKIDLFLGYSAIGQKMAVENPNHNIYFGVSTIFNFTRQKEEALQKTKLIDVKKKKLSNQKSIFDLKLYVNDLLRRLLHQKKLIELAKEKKDLAEKILRAEKKNFFIGRKTLNDLILAKQSLVNSRFNLIKQETIFQSLILELLKSTDQLVTKNRGKLSIYNIDK